MPAPQLTLIDRKRLELARALATAPELLLLDEFMAGLNPAETAAAMALIRRLVADGLTVLMVEHIVWALMDLSRPDHRAERGREDRRGPAGGRRRRSRACSTSTWAADAEAARVLEIARPRGGLRRRPRARRRDALACGAGEIVALLGPNGAGKSTLLQVDRRPRCARAPARIRWEGEDLARGAART